MTNLLRSICLAGVVLSAAVTAGPAAAERGDHDTPATARQQPGYDTPWRYGAPTCRTDHDGWVVCRDRSGHWRRHHHERSGRGPWWADHDDDRDGRWYGRREMIDSRIVVRQLHRQGFDNMSDLKLRGDVYSLKATDPYGQRVIVQIDPYTGRIVNVLRR